MLYKIVLVVLLVTSSACFAQTPSLNANQFCEQIGQFAAHIAANRDNGVSLRASISEVPNAEPIITEIYEDDSSPKETGLMMYQNCLNTHPAYSAGRKQLTYTNGSGQTVAEPMNPDGGAAYSSIALHELGKLLPPVLLGAILMGCVWLIVALVRRKKRG